VTLSMYTLIPTVYRALLKSAVSGFGHRIHHTTKKMVQWSSTKCNNECMNDQEHRFSHLSLTFGQ
jgi:hypothetical protein